VRLILTLLLIVLLPLRSWAGDAMAIQMAAQPATVIQSEAHAIPLASADTVDCAGHTDTAVESAPHCSTCASCQVCFNLAIVPPVVQLHTETLRFSAPTPVRVRFASADIALGQKPPIS
jgi:hypothetical protein